MCLECEDKILDALNKTPKEKFDKSVIEKIMKEADRELAEVAAKVREEFIQLVGNRMTRQQLLESGEYARQIGDFTEQLFLWSCQICNKIVEDSLNSETAQRNTTVAYFNVTIGALQQSNIVDLIIAANADHYSI